MSDIGKYNKVTESSSKSDCKDDCNVGFYINDDQSDCLVCERGQWQDKDGQASCKSCYIGKYNDLSEQTAESSCKECGNKFYNNEQGQAECKNDCAAGSYINFNKTACLECPQGFWQDQDDQDDCKSCGPGTYNGQFESTTIDSCKECQGGHYNDEIGQESCKLCVSGKFNKDDGSKAETDCKVCPAGKRSLSSQRDCVEQGKQEQVLSKIYRKTCSRIGKSWRSITDLSICTTALEKFNHLREPKKDESTKGCTYDVDDKCKDIAIRGTDTLPYGCSVQIQRNVPGKNQLLISLSLFVFNIHIC